MDTWQIVVKTVAGEFSDIPTLADLIRVTLRLLVAGVLGGLLGYERERKGKSAGLRSKSETPPSTIGSSATKTKNNDERAARPGDRNQDTSSTTNIAIGTRLRRKLSKIFQRDKLEIGLRRVFSRPRTHGSTHPAICQSPRIQRCRRAISPLYREGCSS